MLKVNIIVDSTTDLREDIRERVSTIPLTVHFGEEEYIDGVTITHKQFYEKLIESDVLPTTSQATPVNFVDMFKKIVAAGETAVVITLSSKLSGTYQSAMIAAEDYAGSIYVVDSNTVTIGAGILAELALKLADSGMSAKDIAEEITKKREDIRLVAMLDTLEYLKKGGRVSKTVAFAGGILSIKPVISLKDGEINILGKARGSKQGNNLLVEEIQKAGGVDFEKPLLLGYTGLSDMLLKKYIEDSKTMWENYSAQLPVAVVGSIVGTHAGPGAIAVAFFKK